MKTSVENEAPSAKGVFDPQQRQPYTNTDLENKLIHYDKVDFECRLCKQTDGQEVPKLVFMLQFLL